MRFSRIVGTIERRVLINFQLDASVALGLLPAPFSPALVSGRAVAGISLMRLKGLRPAFAPAALGVSCEQATHWIAVSWSEHGEQRLGLYIPRRDTDSRLQTLMGNWLLPGEQHYAQFRVREHDDYLQMSVESNDHVVRVSVAGGLGRTLPTASLFRSTDDLVTFLKQGRAGYAPSFGSGTFEGAEMRCRDWSMRPLAIDHVTASWFEDPALFPDGSVCFDSALVLRQVEHEWITCAPLTSAAPALQVV